ncbi:30S ribosomal protein S1 [Spirochaeta isovalerica]|uniref:Small subunit ribosomal protein S1 n=1 Tax=Spirochaeta isovalerica TaxID=150 RepID=A0A841RAE4_9SPIO|nr:S1 RNA-binding domain-containing protein [Spirochaeta isovalerica]MBB6480341.1 small subunit ribosomal protein S1 [Spirochaeta isovalerica]
MENMENEDFATMFENSYSDMETLEPGQQIETTVISIAGETVFLQLSGKSEGVLDAGEVTDKEGNLTVQEGDPITAYFLSSRNGEMRFTTKISGEEANDEVLENAYRNAIPVEGLVQKEIKGGFEVKIGNSRAFCPYSQMGLKRVENAAEYVGQHLTFKITEFGEKGRNILVSNRVILEEERQQQIEELKKELKKGSVIKATVLSLQDFGAFVDVRGFQALLPISEISRTRINDISAVLSVGQEIEAAIISVDWEKERMSVSMKELIADPWDTAVDKYRPGTRHEGKVVRITDFGAFVTLEPGLDGLVHVSELKGESRDNHPRDIVKKGQTLAVEINSVDTDRKRISLKQVSSLKEDESVKKYMESDSDTYNPFADFFKDKK